MADVSEDNLEQLWVDQQYYKKAVSYWDRQPADVDGVLGGFGNVSATDIRDSKRLLEKVYGSKLKQAEEGTVKLVALDCGSGVGRIAQDMLLHFCAEVDLVEPSKHLLETAKKLLAGAGLKPFPADHRAARFYQQSLQDFHPEPGRYDIFWVQWCLMYLTDTDALAWLDRCAKALKPGGIIVIKENLANGNERFTLDEEDASVARSDEYLRQLFQSADMKLLLSMAQRGFPASLMKVKMYALRPNSMMT
mmetsp:Transcript_18713/g.56620  ORF Transcript_18713/g.56620 Transcript_18713/m.56620 type:complete len:249 (+) Transcript_18713:303-1049(+)|eukprot:CAMPEP_0206141088 /NCGR_PEP_ID=MMETSP1473-20131121/11763_1 /ASSEMBLY_ACC=CAM_ASM_001109 /TAXON_ID=1461547 /ORGANISM="Stichococcus sp, Strain RCC1054" /LENGTH=248 /DNA_ID=CAMNT_0053535501 /DNA_START=198 /DNA_END=944 /DNA_ORIENTATION=-